MITVTVQVKPTDQDLLIDLYTDDVALRDVLLVFNDMVMHSDDWPMQIIEFSPDRIVIESAHLVQVGERGSVVVEMPHDGFTYIFTPPSSTDDFDRFTVNVYAYATAFSELCGPEVRYFIIDL